MAKGVYVMEFYKLPATNKNGTAGAEWRWRLKAPNGRIVQASCEGFRRYARCSDNAFPVWMGYSQWLKCGIGFIGVQP